MGNACSCGPPPPDFLSDLRNVFLSYHATGQSTESLLVTKGIVIGLTSNNRGVFFKPLQNYYGKTISDTIIIWGTDGTDCRVGVVGFYKIPPDTFVFFMNRNVYKDYLYEDTNDFHISACGNAVLKIKNDSVFGGHYGTFAWAGFPLKQFEEDSLNFWIHALKVDASAQPSIAAILFPNPVGVGRIVKLHGVFDEPTTIVLYDVTGKVVRTVMEHARGDLRRDIPISLSGLREGAYFLRIVSSSRTQTLPFSIIDR